MIGRGAIVKVTTVIGQEPMVGELCTVRGTAFKYGKWFVVVAPLLCEGDHLTVPVGACEEIFPARVEAKP